VTAISKKGLLGIQIVKGSITGTDFACFLLGIIKNHKDIEENLKEYYFLWITLLRKREDLVFFLDFSLVFDQAFGLFEGYSD